MTREQELKDNAQRSEKALERKLCLEVKSLGGVALKHSCATQSGFPDRICILPTGLTVWVELKSSGKNPSPLQSVRIHDLRHLGHEVFVCRSAEELATIAGFMRDEVERRRRPFDRASNLRPRR